MDFAGGGNVRLFARIDKRGAVGGWELEAGVKKGLFLHEEVFVNLFNNIARFHSYSDIVLEH